LVPEFLVSVGLAVRYHVDANYRHGPDRRPTVQLNAYVDACPGQPQRARVAVPRCCT